MSKFFSIPGLPPFRSRGRALPSMDENPMLKGWLDSRSPTSHGTLGLDPGMHVDLDLHGEHRDAVVVREEGDMKTGAASVIVKSKGSLGRDQHHEIKFVPDTARTMIQAGHPRRVRN